MINKEFSVNYGTSSRYKNGTYISEDDSYVEFPAGRVSLTYTRRTSKFTLDIISRYKKVSKRELNLKNILDLTNLDTAMKQFKEYCDYKDLETNVDKLLKDLSICEI